MDERNKRGSRDADRRRQANRQNGAAGGKGGGTVPKKKKRRRLKPFRVAVLVVILLLLIAGIVAAVLLLIRPGSPQDGEDGRKEAVFGIKKIEVEGSERYTDEEIVQASGFYIGQSIFSLKKRQAAENILAAFPYIEKVTVDSPAFSTVKITVVESEPIALVAQEDGWIILGANGKGLEALPAGSERMGEYLRIRAQQEEGAGVGSRMLSDETMTVIQRLLAAFSDYSLGDIREIDLQDRTDIRINWRDQITIALGNDTNLEHEIQVAVTVLPKILDKYGEDTRGVMDMSSYSGSDPDRYQTVYTPEELLPTTTTTGESGGTTSSSPATTTTSAAGETTTTTAAAAA